MTKVAGAKRGVFGANTRTAATRVGDMTYVKHDQFIGRSLKTYGEWAQLEIDRLLDYLAPGDFAIDVGANIGFHTLSFARKVGKSGAVWAFEPDPVNGLLLRHNILQSGLDEVIIPFDFAVSEKLGICRFRTVPIAAPENFGHTGVDPGEGDYPRIALPLDALLIDRAPALIKIDIEGHELPALAGMCELIDKHRPVLSVEADAPDEVEAYGAFLAAMGYDIYSLVVSAYNPGNFAENPTDIWKGYGRCGNLLCVVPGKHNAPEGLDLVRRADPGREAVSHLGKSVGAAYSAMSVLEGDSGDPPAEQGLSAARAEIKRFISTFLKATYGKLDPVTDAAIVDGALDFLAANGPAAEGVALQQLIVAGVQSFVDGLDDRAKFAELEQLRSERELLRVTAGQLQSELDALRIERQDLEAAHARTFDDITSRLATADATQIRLSAELAQQADSARREVAEALASAAEADKRAFDAEAQAAQLSAELTRQSEAARLEVAAALEQATEAEQRAASVEAQVANLTADLAAREADLEALLSQSVEREAELVEARTVAERDSLRLSAELARQSEIARQDVAAALAQVEAAERRAADAEAQAAQLSAELTRQSEAARLEVAAALEQATEAGQRAASVEAQVANLTAELARQSEIARQDVAAALAQVEEAERRAADAEKLGRDQASDLEKLAQRLATALEQHDQLKSELARSKKRASQEASELSRKLKAAKGEAKETAMQVAQLQEEMRELEQQCARLQGEQESLSSELAEAQERLAVQAQQLRQLRLG